MSPRDCEPVEVEAGAEVPSCTREDDELGVPRFLYLVELIGELARQIRCQRVPSPRPIQCEAANQAVGLSEQLIGHAPARPKSPVPPCPSREALVDVDHAAGDAASERAAQERRGRAHLVGRRSPRGSGELAAA